MTLVLDRLAGSDVPALARLHRTAFPGFFLSELGEPFLVEFYRGFVADDTAVTVVARDATGTVLGAVVGTVQPAAFFRRLLARRWLGFALASLRAVVRDPSTAGRLLRAVGYRGGTPTGAGGALLSSICVDPARRGTGVGRRLIEAWTRQVAARGVGAAYLTTDAVGNPVVNRFYQALGWSLGDTYRTREGRAMNIYTKRLETR